MATMVNMNNLLNGKDSRWLQLEVCREFQRNKCSRPDTECKFAHPPANVEVQNGRVTACYDSIKGRCNREKPPCKYFHPPQHLKDQLLINGRNHLALKNALMQQMGIAPGQPVIPGQVQTVDVQNGNTSVSPIGFSLQFGSQPIMATNPYLTGMPTSTYSHYFAPGHLMPTILGPDPSTVSPLGPVVPQAVPVAQQKIPRSDRLEKHYTIYCQFSTSPARGSDMEFMRRFLHLLTDTPPQVNAAETVFTNQFSFSLCFFFFFWINQNITFGFLVAAAAQLGTVLSQAHNLNAPSEIVVRKNCWLFEKYGGKMITNHVQWITFGIYSKQEKSGWVGGFEGNLIF
ncbi:protein muscleblind isoform X8 [Phlebotomus argentipes]|uniref:protein muscleblind isoform X8 n=1 Tax=Phlebotomus argentipes TaxID=94469 RepID=UPI002892B529|nr:protein muscleblind isoform X8 [Phlebotomus argentipes]